LIVLELDPIPPVDATVGEGCVVFSHLDRLWGAETSDPVTFIRKTGHLSGVALTAFARNVVKKTLV
jgi:hypothetical protein